MTELDLYKFIENNSIEYHHYKNEGKEDVIIFINYDKIQDFSNLLGNEIFDEEGIDCTMKDGYFCFWMNEICDYHDVEIGNVFQKESIKNYIIQ